MRSLSLMSFHRGRNLKGKKDVFPVNLAGSSYRMLLLLPCRAVQRRVAHYLCHGSLKGYSTFFIPHRSLDLIEPEAVLAERHLQEFAEKYFEDYPRLNVWQCMAIRREIQNM